MGKEIGKVCAIMCMNAEFGIFLLDLDVDVDVGVKDTDGIRPNFRIHLGDVEKGFLFYVANDSLYIFRMLAGGIPVHSVPLQRVSGMKNVLFDDDQEAPLPFPECGRCAPKYLPTSLAYGNDGKVLIFSTEIRFQFFVEKTNSPRYYDGDFVFDDDAKSKSEGESEEDDDELKIEVDPNVFDFELYDTRSGTSTVLPQLLVCYKRLMSHYCCLYDSSRSEVYDSFPQKVALCSDDTFLIDAFAVDGDKFIIKTNFGKIFCLDLQPQPGDVHRWILCEDQGYEFVAWGETVVTPQGICFNDIGANDSRKKWLQSRSQSDQRDPTRYVRFPDLDTADKPGLSRVRHGRSVFDLLKNEDDSSFMLRFIAGESFDPASARWMSTQQFLCVDLLKLNLKRFPHNQDDKVENFVQLIKTFIFTASAKEHVIVALVAGLFCC